VKTNILLALSDQTWQLEVMTYLNDQESLKIKRRCVDAVDLLAAVHMGLAEKIIISADFQNLNSESIAKAQKQGCEIYGLYIQDDIESFEKISGFGITNNFAISTTAIEKSIENLVSRIVNNLRSEELTKDLDAFETIPGLTCIWGTSGSPGRTATAINISFSLASKQFPTLLVDLDAVAPSIAPSLGLISEVPGISSVVHDALKGRLNFQSISQNIIEVNPNLHVLTGITNPKRWPELRTEGLVSVMKQCSQMYSNIICDLSSLLPESKDSSMQDLNIFRRFDHIPKILSISTRNLFVLSATPLSLIRASESLENLKEINKNNPLIIVNKMNNINLGSKYEPTLEAILGRWVNKDLIQKIPDRPEIFAESWMKAESVLRLGDNELTESYQKISELIRNDISKPPRYKRFLRKVS
jgi:MinD-like ATPase involved in chromosome partitioning or flagellar assembly